MKTLKTCPHCGQQPTVSKILDDVLIECVDHNLIAQAATNDEAAALWETIVDTRINSHQLTCEAKS